ncbi:hypothetical protein WL37_17230 [Burkholderia ubonensis]|uniref:hypothetical protein n=1 Tax=Burkholderia ubonensis TaxID=101571 RepID=UPI00075725CE|nr:hypothetical protein [Burkholderia ubonensis]KWB44580.1 hypothetical protein WL37_17230 [Burkholderia ubonensis]
METLNDAASCHKSVIKMAKVLAIQVRFRFCGEALICRRLKSRTQKVTVILSGWIIEIDMQIIKLWVDGI